MLVSPRNCLRLKNTGWSIFFAAEGRLSGTHAVLLIPIKKHPIRRCGRSGVFIGRHLLAGHRQGD
jgi:hypothetical protein